MSLRIIDMAGTVDLLKDADGKMAGKTTVVKVTEKSPGAGADTTVSFVMQMFVMAMSHISLTQEVKEMASTARDTMHKQVSKMSYALFQGSGVLVNSKREIMSSTFQSEISNNGHFTELFKNDDDQLAWIESLMAHSGDVQVGAESGVAQAAWSTTMNLENMSIERLKPIPVIVLTGNRPAHSTPASAVEGGRWMHVASSTQDKENGFFIVHRRAQAQNALRHSLPVRFALSTLVENEQNATLGISQKSKRARVSNQLSTDNVRLNIKIITREDVYNNMMFFLLMQWLRKDAALLLSTLTHEAQNYSYSFKCTFSRIECAVGQLTRGLRRDFLESNPDYWHRNAMGPWAKVLQISMHVMLTMSSAMITGLARTRDGWPLDLHLSFVSGVRSLLTNTISFTAIVASLHLWLASAVLDYNFMILSCYMYHFTAFQHSCPLRVLSLVMRGFEVDDEEFEQYLRFCEHLAPCVLEASVLSERTDFGPRNVASGVLQMPSHTTLADWYTYHVPALHSDISKAHAARTQGAAQERFSVYCQPRLSFVHKEPIKGFGRPREGNTQAPDPNVCGTPSRVIGTSVGAAQKLAEHQRRVDKGACIDGRMDGRAAKLQEWENTTEFWKRVRKGTLLPEASTATNDMHKIKFEYVPFTGLWWDQTMANAEHCDGIVQSFLLQSDLDTDISVHGFFENLFAPFLRHSQRDERVYGGPHAPGAHTNAWATPVLNALRPFQFVCAPYIDAQHLPKGVNVNVSMSLVHYVVVQGLGVTRDWSCAAHDNSKFVSCVHLRNTSHMTLGLLSLLMHTCCEKAMVPANNGLLRLPLPSPVFNTQTEAVVEYDHRLHVDSTLHIMGGASDNMLSIDSRLAKRENWRLLAFQDGRCALGYASVYSELSQQPASARHLFPFPPEAVAHAADMYKYMTLAHRRFIEVLDKEELDVAADENHFALAMLGLGNSIRFEEHHHVQPSLTDCVIRGAREIPCVTCQHAFLFVMTFAEGTLHVRPVAPTLEWAAARAVAGDTPPFQALPAEEASLPASAFAKFFRHGLKMHAASADDACVVVDLNYSEEKRLPFYMFPVVFWPVLVKLSHDGWTMPVPADFEDFKDDELLLHSCEFFYSNTCRTYHVRSVAQDGAWLRQHCPALVAAVAPEFTDVEAYFHSKQTTELLGVWARVAGVRVHFDSLEHLRADVRRGINVSRFVPLSPGAQQYYMLEHNVWGATPVLLGENGRHSASFSYFVDDSEDQRFLAETQAKLALAREQCDAASIAAHTETIAELQAHMLSTHMLSTPQMTELFRDVHFSFNDFIPNMIPLHHGQQQGDAVWGLTVEQDAAFLHNGCYHVSAAGKSAQADVNSTELVHCLLDMDFISMSRCMVQEGTELWIRITAEIYAIILQQAQNQGSSLMLPVSQALHNGMPAELSRYLRAFYVLGGSVHDQQLADNQVSLVCVIASKNSGPGKKTTADDAADALSRVNQSISVDNTRFVAISLPILLHGAAVFDHTRDPALPFYKYLKEKPVARQR